MRDKSKPEGTGNFGAYSFYYDEIYSDKDYDFEANWIYAKILDHTPSKRIRRHLDLGAGTGKHAFRLAQKGIKVTGVELSSEMVSLAPKHENLSMVHGNLTEYFSKEEYSSCSAMFHVLSYMRSVDQLAGALRNAMSLIEPGGIIIFDVWHSPAVEHLGAELRVKRVSRPGLDILRLAEPTQHPHRKTVSVEYTLFVSENGAKGHRKVSETHVLRHYDTDEVTFALSSAGLSLLESFETFTGKALAVDTWSACYVAVKI